MQAASVRRCAILPAKLGLVLALAICLLPSVAFDAAAPAAQAPPSGNPAAGQALYNGVIPLRNGGAACIACHNAASAGALGGGTLGPDLTQAYNKFGEAGLATLLQTLPFPTMRPVYENAPLTDEERSNLLAYLQTTSSLRPASSTGQVALLAGGVFALLLGAVQLAWRRRLRAVRRPLVEASTKSRRDAA